MPVMFKPLKNERFFEKVASSIQREILLGNLQPGQKLPNETELARQFSVGRSAVREALKVLELSGFLVVKRGFNGGTFVRPPDQEDSHNATPSPLAIERASVDQLMEARKTIEVKTSELAAIRAEETEIASLKQLLSRMKAVAVTPARFINADVDFHVCIAEAAKNEVFLVMINAVKTSLKNDTNKVIAQPGAVEEILDDHSEICKHIAARNPRGAIRAMERHLEAIERRLESAHL